MASGKIAARFDVIAGTCILRESEGNGAIGRIMISKVEMAYSGLLPLVFAEFHLSSSLMRGIVT
jgi:hypothetical protein